MKCLVCKLLNATIELQKHPNSQTIFIVRKLIQKNNKNVKEQVFCQSHINDSQERSVVISTAVKVLTKVHERNKEHKSKSKNKITKELHNGDSNNSESNRNPDY